MSSPIALVTGALGGLGTAICQRLAADGYRVVGHHHPVDTDHAAGWLEQQRQTDTAGELSMTVAADVSDFEACETMGEHIRAALGEVSILVNNAGITRDVTLKKMQQEQWQAVIDTNLGSMFNVSRQFVDGMMQQGFGRIVNISSINGQRGQFGQTNYSAAKAGVHGFTMALAQETAARGVTVNSISPGFIDTDMVQSIPEPQRLAIIESIPVGRVGMPDDIAHAVSFLADARSSYITGINLASNGGVFMH